MLAVFFQNSPFRILVLVLGALCLFYLLGQAFTVFRTVNLEIFSVKENTVFTEGVYTINGKVDKGSALSFNGTKVLVSDDGLFEQTLALLPGSTLNLRVVAVGKFGGKVERDIVLVSDVLRREEVLFFDN